MYDVVIVGAGFAGATLAERFASQLDQRVLVLERRNHIAGNAYDYFDEHGLLCHRYGPHVFHTNSKQVWDYLSQFTDWHPYEHRVFAVVDGQQVPVPFNLTSLHTLFPKQRADKLEKLLYEHYGFSAKVPILKLRESEIPELRMLASYIYEKIFYGYTVKQWELTPEQLDASVTSRVPVVVSRDDRYFQDSFQAIPLLGYTTMFRRILDHPNIVVQLESDYRGVATELRAKLLIYTGPIDEFFDYCYGPLPYRSLRFEHFTLGLPRYQDAGVVNYPNDYEFTRITEQKHLTGQISPSTTLVFEYPQRHIPGHNEPYYPIPQESNRELYRKYQALADKAPNVCFVGRLATYQYYNMDQVVAQALATFERLGGSQADPVGPFASHRVGIVSSQRREGKMSIWCVVVTYNRPGIAKSCVDALLAQTQPPDRILVIENSENADMAELYAGQPRVAVERPPEGNIGGAASFARGMATAFKSGASAVVLCDDDFIADLTMLAELLRASMEASMPGILAAVSYVPSSHTIHPLLSTDNTDGLSAYPLCINGIDWAEQFGLRRTKRSLETLEEVRGFADAKSTRILEVQNAAFHGMLVPRSVYDRIGLPRADFFISGDDTEYCLRAQRHGMPVLLVSQAGGQHKFTWGAYYGVKRLRFTVPTVSPPVAYYVTRNHLWVVRLYHRSKSRCVLDIARVLSRSVRMMALGRGSIGDRVRAQLRGIVDGLFWQAISVQCP